MTYWGKLFIVVLLALSLPVQSFAAVSMKCAIVDATAEAPLGYAGHDLFAHELASNEAVARALDHDRHPCESCRAHCCSTCASCCFAIALPVHSTLAMPPDATRVVTHFPPSAGVVSFLTGGIERPPRYAPI